MNQKNKIGKEAGKPSKRRGGIRIGVGIEPVEANAEFIQERRTERVGFVDLPQLRSQFLRGYLPLIEAKSIVG